MKNNQRSQSRSSQRTVGAVLFGLLLAAGSGAQEPGVKASKAESAAPLGAIMDRTQALMQGATFSPNPGDWVRYRMEVSPSGLVKGASANAPRFVMKVKFSSPLHADREHPLAQGQRWIEMEFLPLDSSMESAMTLKTLIQGDPRDDKAILRLLLQAGKRLPMEIAVQKLPARSDSQAACAKADATSCAAAGGSVVRHETQKIYTQVGWLEATRVTITYPQGQGVGESWVSPKVPLLGLVRATVPFGLKMELEAFGGGALSRIDESKAVPMPELEQLQKRLQAP